MMGILRLADFPGGDTFELRLVKFLVYQESAIKSSGHDIGTLELEMAAEDCCMLLRAGIGQ